MIQTSPPGSISIGVVPANGKEEGERLNNVGNDPREEDEEDKDTTRRFTESPLNLSESDEDDDEGASDTEDRRNGKVHATNEGHGEYEAYDGQSAGDDGPEGDDDDDEEEEEEDEEPSLKYQRINGSIPDLLKKDSASALAISNKVLAMGTHTGIIHILDLTGKRIKSFKPHMASIVDISLDAMADFVASASIDGQVVVYSLSTTEKYSFDMKRPMRTVAMEPNFGRRSTRAFVCGGLSGALVLREKGWLGHKETTIHRSEGPIWQVRWRGHLIAWASDNGVRIYDHNSQTQIAFIDRPADSPRPDLFKCNLYWQDESTLLIGWADLIKVTRIRSRPRTTVTDPSTSLPPLLVEITAVFKLDCMVAGLVPHPVPTPSSAIDRLPDSLRPDPGKSQQQQQQQQMLTSFLIIAYTPPEAYDDTDEMTDDRARQARKAAERPEMRIISRAGQEADVDVLVITDYQNWSCNDYALVEATTFDDPLVPYADRSYVILSPRELVKVMPRDKRDHVDWLVERKRYEEALKEAEAIENDEAMAIFKPSAAAVGSEEENKKVYSTAQEIGQKFIEHLVAEGNFEKAAQLCPKVCAHYPKRWENWIFTFAQLRQLQVIIPYVPTDNPRLDHLVYEMMLAHFLTHNRKALLQTIKEWPREIYDIAAVIVAVRAELDKTTSSSATISSSESPSILMECLADLYTANRQPGKALPYYLRLRRPNVFDLIRENNLFTDVQDQVLLLVEFDHELMEKARFDGKVKAGSEVQSEAIRLLVDNIHSIPITRVVQQLQQQPYYLFLYLDAVSKKDPHLVVGFADVQVKMYAEFATHRLIDFLRASSSYDLELAYQICLERDLVPEMVFLLGRMGNNKKALTLIIERMGDVQRAIEFAKEQGDDDLWEDLLGYSETRPSFIRGLLENVGVEISPIRLIRRIKNGLEIPGLKEALIKILQEFHLQISLLEGCQEILNGDSSDLSRKLHRNQSGGFFLSARAPCDFCNKPLQDSPRSGLTMLFLCRHAVHATCVTEPDNIPSISSSDYLVRTGDGISTSRGISGSIVFESMLKSRIEHGCPVCHRNEEGKIAIIK